MTISYEELEELALNLSIKEQARLVERVASSVATQLRKQTTEPEAGHWGKRVLEVLEQYPIEEWQAIENPVEWLAEQRADSLRRLNWDAE